MGKSQRNAKGAKGPTPQLRSRNTRSSKGRLLTETESSTTLLTSQLSLLGLYAAPTIGDGNCLFRALSDQLYGSPSKHYELRQQICDHIATHKARYEPFVEDERGLEGHLRAMREHATYGGHMELSAFAHMTKRNVKVIQPGLVYVIEWRAGESSSTSTSTSGATESTSAVGSGSDAGGGGVDGTPRRSRRMSTKSASSPMKQKPKVLDDDKEEVRVKVGKGYYVYEEVSSDDEDEEERAPSAVPHNVSVKQEETPAPEQSLIAEGGGPTVYVAYHDWEHFSSIRNLRGPHTGLPNVCETPAPSIEPFLPKSAKDSEKERERERKKERERKEKERKERERERRVKEKATEKDREKSGLKVKLRLPLSTASSSSSSIAPATSASVSTTSVVDAGLQQPQQQDPTLVPLPSSRSSSPFIHAAGSSSTSSLLGGATPLSSTSLPSSSLASEVYPDTGDEEPTPHIPSQSLPVGMMHLLHPHPHPHPTAARPPVQQMQSPRSQYRSPKRSFDESSASGGEDTSGAGSGGTEKRSRRRVGSTSGSGAVVASGLRSSGEAGEGEMINLGGVEGEPEEEDMEVDVDGDAGADTPGLSAPGSSSSSSSNSSRSSSIPASASGEVSDAEDEDEGEVDVDVVDPEGRSLSMALSSTTTSSSGSPPPADSADATIKLPSQPSVPGSLVMPEGLSKKARQRYLHTHLHSVGGEKPLTRRQRKSLGLPKVRGPGALSAGKIVIPGGRWKGRGDAEQVQVQGAGVGVVETDVDEEWRRNGTGRLDVRGFRELKI